MNKVACYPRKYKPDKFDDDTWYFEVLSTPVNPFDNVGYVGARILNELRRSHICPSTLVFDFMMIAYAVVAADKAILRKDSSDGWTRVIDLSLYVHEQEKWEAQQDKIQDMLRFLTGDFWELHFNKINNSIVPKKKYALYDNDCICLLSGGMDSLVGAIDLHEAGHNPLFVSQIVRGDAEHQRKYATAVGKGNLCQWSSNVKKRGSSENSTRSRSIVFFAYALLAACGIKKNTDGRKVIYVPENGFISLNIPLNSMRIGSLSTKTTHPIYMKMLQEVWNAVGIEAELVLPYKFMTKGEVLAQCKNKKLMKDLIFGSTSCGKYQRHGLRHCGTCVPCLVRRAAFIKARLKDDTEGGYCAENLKNIDSRDLSAAAMACVQVEKHGVESLVKGALSFAKGEERKKYLLVIQNGIEEIRKLLEIQGIL